MKTVYDEAVKKHTTREIWMVYALLKDQKASFERKGMAFDTKKFKPSVKVRYEVVKASFDFNL